MYGARICHTKFRKLHQDLCGPTGFCAGIKFTVMCGSIGNKLCGRVRKKSVWLQNANGAALTGYEKTSNFIDLP
jgi:hypothetical protein